MYGCCVLIKRKFAAEPAKSAETLSEFARVSALSAISAAQSSAKNKMVCQMFKNVALRAFLSCPSTFRFSAMKHATRVDETE
jgi:hypothetical protein